MDGDRLSWSEVGDAVWLASVTRPKWRARGDEPVESAARPQDDAEIPEPPPAGPESKPHSEPVPGSNPTDLPDATARPDQGAADDQRVDPPAARGPAEIESTRHDVLGRASTLPEAAAIVRALRPLRRLVPSRPPDDVELDEERTAERAVQDGLWLPATRPTRRRWLDLTLVVDAHPATALWRSQVLAFEELLVRVGAFRTVRRRLLDLREGVPVLLGGAARTVARSHREVIDSTGRRVILLLTGGIGATWQGDAYAPVLADWGRSMPTAVVNLRRQHHWRRSGLAVQRARITTHGTLHPNAQWSFDLLDAWLEPDRSPAAQRRAVPVPVLEMRSRWLTRWAQLLTGRGDGPLDATVLLAHDSPVGSDFAQPAGESISPLDRVNMFLATASPPARRLATLLAAVPVSLPVAQLIRSELVPVAETEHVAEVLTSGLFAPASDSPGGWDKITFDADEGVREELLRGARRSETALVIRLVVDRCGGSVGNLGHVMAALDDPDATPHPDASDIRIEDIKLERIVMTALGGPYLGRAAQLAQRIANSTSASENMPNPDSGVGVTTEPNRPVGVDAKAPAPAGEQTLADSVAPFPSPLLTSPWPRLSSFERQDSDTPPVWGNIPQRNPNFTGRSEMLGELEERLTAGTTAVLPAALHGMGGIGKTQLAVEYIYRHLRDYDLVWWIQAAQATQIRAGLTELAQALGLPGGAEANTALPAVREALRTGNPLRKWLLVFDAAEGPEVVRPFFPASGPGDILVTSRNPDWASVASPLGVTTFERSESIELLRRRGPDVDEADAERLAEVLGDLPLAVEQAAAWRAETGMPVSEYLRLFEEKVAEILDTSTPTGYDLSVAAAWTVSFDELRGRSPAAHQLLQVCAFFSPEPIPRSLFTGVRGTIIAPELDAALRDPMQLGRAIRDISRYGLAKIDHRNSTLQLHRLVQLVLRNRMAPQHEAEFRHGAHQLLANVDPNDPLSATQWQRYSDLLPHAYAANLIECGEGWGRQLIINLVDFLYRWGDHKEAVELAERTLAAWSERLGEDDPQTLQVGTMLGFLYWNVGRYADAARLRRRTLDIRREVDGENSDDTLSAQLSVAADLRTTGDFAAGAEMTATVCEMAKSLFGEDDPTALNAARRHAISLRMTSQYQAALALDEDTLKHAVEVFGPDHPETLNLQTGIILDRRELGDYVRVRDDERRHVEHVRRVLGENTANSLRRQAYFAVDLRKAGDHAAALEMSKTSLNQFLIRYGQNNFEVMACTLAYSIDLRHAGNHRDARALGEEMVERYRQNLGDDHPYTWSSAVDLGVTMRLLGEPAAARSLDERSFERLRILLGPDHSLAIVAAINLASDHAALGDAETAITVGTEALERSERVLGTDHPTTLAASLNLSFDLRRAGREDDASTRYVDALTRYRRMLGEQHPAAVTAAKGVRANCDIDPLPL